MLHVVQPQYELFGHSDLCMKVQEDLLERPECEVISIHLNGWHVTIW